MLYRFWCSYHGREVFSVKLDTVTAANPFIGFLVRASESGSLLLTWTDDDGTVHRLEHKLTVA